MSAFNSIYRNDTQKYETLTDGVVLNSINTKSVQFSDPSGQNALTQYREIPVSIVFSGAITNTANGNLTRIGRLCTLEIRTFSTTSVANGSIQSNVFIPADCRPPTEGTMVVAIMNVGANALPVAVQLTNLGALNIVLGQVSGANVVFSNLFPTGQTIAVLNRIAITWTLP
jgi:hypothetical protein